MSGVLILDWLSQVVSLGNIFVLAWIGLTILLNAERRVWGVYLAFSGTLAGVFFFAIHSAILYGKASGLLRGLYVWWHLGWAPLVIAPFVWYLVMLWYSGFWDSPESALRKRQALWLRLMLVISIGIAILLLVNNPLPAVYMDRTRTVRGALSLSDVPVTFLIYPPFLYTCILLSLDALLRPAPTGRIMGDMARLKARPWLISSSAILLLIGCIAGVAMFWLVQSTRQSANLALMIHHNSRFLTELDILLAGLILVAMLSVGKAVVSYEVFTGGSLPRRGLLRHWMFALWVGIFFSLIGAFLLVYPEGILEGVLAAALLVAAGLVLAMQESLKERERTIHQLRPLLDVDPLLSSIISPLETKPAGLDLQTTFANLCRETWQTRQAMLVPLGQLATLGVSPLIYAGEGDRNIQMPPLPGLDEISHSTTGIPLQGEAGCGFIWMVPLRNERGLIGVCYLGEKNDGGFYSKEEIELVGDSAERIADWMFVAELARRLVILQRQRMVENQVLDRRTRLVLHDEVLPRLHTILLRAGSLSETETSQAKEIVDELSRLHRQISGLLRELPPSAPPDLQSRGLCAAIRNLVEVELASEFDQVFVEIDPEADQNSRLMPALVIEVFYYAAREVVRNAARHGRGQRERNLVLNLSAKWNSGLELVIEDNGEGLDSTKAGSTGSGQGLALHATLMAVIGGSLALASEAGKYTRAILFISREELN